MWINLCSWWKFPNCPLLNDPACFYFVSQGWVFPSMKTESGAQQGIRKSCWAPEREEVRRTERWYLELRETTLSLTLYDFVQSHRVWGTHTSSFEIKIIIQWRCVSLWRVRQRIPAQYEVRRNFFINHQHLKYRPSFRGEDDRSLFALFSSLFKVNKVMGKKFSNPAWVLIRFYTPGLPAGAQLFCGLWCYLTLSLLLSSLIFSSLLEPADVCQSHAKTEQHQHWT